MKSVAVLVSGGVDSLVAYRLARQTFGSDNIAGVFVDCGQPYLQKEKDAISELFLEKEEANIIDVKADLCIPELDNVPTVDRQEIFGRNLLLAFYGALVSDTVWLSILHTEMNATAVRDKQPEFLHMTSALLTYILKNRQADTVVMTPFATMTKTEVVAHGLYLGLTKKDFLATVSCYDGVEKSCGRCSTCFKRWIAFQNNGIEEQYETPIEENNYGNKICREMRVVSCNGGSSERYSLKRLVETHNALVSKGMKGIYPEQSKKNVAFRGSKWPLK